MYTQFVEKFRRKVNFTQVPQSEDGEKLLSDSESSRKLENLPPRGLSRCSIISFFVILSCLAFVAGVWLGSHWPFHPASFCTRYTSQYSPPVLNDIHISYSPVRFNGSLMKENAFRQSAGPVVDGAWKSLGVDYRSLIVPADQAVQAGLLPDQVKVSEKYGGGFPANVEGLHHLHCLNVLRKALYYNFDYYHALGEGAFKNNDTILRYHVSHCLDIIRQQLMCTVDIGVLGQVWWNPAAPTPYVDFNTEHKCRDFEAIRQWAEERQAPDDVPLDYLQPPVDGDTIYATLP